MVYTASSGEREEELSGMIGAGVCREREKKRQAVERERENVRF